LMVLSGVWHVAPGLMAGPLNQAPSTYFLYREQAQSFEPGGGLRPRQGGQVGVLVEVRRRRGGQFGEVDAHVGLAGRPDGPSETCDDASER